MITPAYFEDDMNDLYSQMNVRNSEDIKKKAIEDVTAVLKQFGYDCGTETFLKIIGEEP